MAYSVWFNQYIRVTSIIRMLAQHVKKLVDADLLQVQKKDRFSYYYVHLGTLQNYLDATKKFENM